MCMRVCVCLRTPMCISTDNTRNTYTYISLFSSLSLSPLSNQTPLWGILLRVAQLLRIPLLLRGTRGRPCWHHPRHHQCHPCPRSVPVTEGLGDIGGKPLERSGVSRMRNWRNRDAGRLRTNGRGRPVSGKEELATRSDFGIFRFFLLFYSNQLIPNPYIDTYFVFLARREKELSTSTRIAIYICMYIYFVFSLSQCLMLYTFFLSRESNQNSLYFETRC